MSKLYSELSEIYELMYASFIDYNNEYKLYGNILRSYQKESVLEIGSGTGNLASLFEENGFKYLGLDMSVDMLEIARRKNPSSVFVEGDMRNFLLDELMDSVIITGRSISYLLKNEDVNSAFKSAHKNLKKGGIFCFDFIDATRFIPKILDGNIITHEAKANGLNYKRESIWKLNLEFGMDLTWESKYFKEQNSDLIEIGTDSEIARPFTKDEIELFLIINNFKLKELIDRDTYAFPTYVVVAEKN